MKLTPYLNFNGNCAAAFRFYERVLGGKITFTQTFGDSPAKDHVPLEFQDKVMHTTLAIGDQELMGSDAPPGTFQPQQGISVTIGVKTAAEGERIFKALAENGKVTMPFEKTFWAAGFGMVVDQFGTPWMVNAEA